MALLFLGMLPTVRHWRYGYGIVFFPCGRDKMLCLFGKNWRLVTRSKLKKKKEQRRA